MSQRKQYPVTILNPAISGRSSSGLARSLRAARNEAHEIISVDDLVRSHDRLS